MTKLDMEEVTTYLHAIRGNHEKVDKDRMSQIISFLEGMPAVGLTMHEFLKFREYIEVKIKGLQGSAGSEALKFVDTEDDSHRLMAKKYQAEETALREVLNELEDRRQRTLTAIE
jgi:hypothetical protein